MSFKMTDVRCFLMFEFEEKQIVNEDELTICHAT